MQTTIDRIEFVRRRIAERRELADGFRSDALGNHESAARECFEKAKILEAEAVAAERVLAVLFDM